jgi:REP element-mobilizing transposase RayT
MARLTHPFLPGAYYHITTRTHRDKPVFKDERLAKIAFDDFVFYGRKYNLQNIAYVVMKDHIHWLFQPCEDNFELFVKQQTEMDRKYSSDPEKYYLVKIMEDYKRHVSYEVNKFCHTPGRKLWQSGFFDHILHKPEEVRQTANYVIFNPVKGRIVDDPKDYPFVGGEALDWT